MVSFARNRLWLIGVIALVFLLGISASTETAITYSDDTIVQQIDETTYQITTSTGKTSPILHTQPQINLRNLSFDPLTDSRATIHQADPTQTAWIIQYKTIPLDAYRQSLTDAGATIHAHIPPQSHIVTMPPAVKAQVESFDFVRWVGPYQAAYKIDQTIGLTARTQTPTRYSIMLLAKGPDIQTTVSQFIDQIGGEVNQLTPQGQRIEATLTESQLTTLLNRPEILFIDRWSLPETDVDTARQAGGANHIEAVAGYAGEGVRGEVVDSGLATDHPDFQARPPLVIHNHDYNDHGTPVYGILFGDGSGNPQARGLLPQAQGVFASYFPIHSGADNRYAHTEQLVDPNDMYRVVFQTNSWGNAKTTDYTTISAELDDIIFQTDLLTLNSMGNSGDNRVRPQAWSKNVISVGGYNHYNTATTTDDSWSHSGSIGPAADGRIKPDLSFYVDDIHTTKNTGDYMGNFSGTSAATPLVAGHAGLFFQMWADGVFEGTIGLNRDVFDTRPHASTAKALMINTAHQHPFTGTTADMTRTHQGWGTPNVQNAFDLAQFGQIPIIVNETAVLTPFDTHTYALNVVGTCPVRATLVYTDPAGNPSAAQHRINDLTLKATTPTGTVFWGNHGLTASPWSLSGGNPDTINTVENIFVQNPPLGTWTIEVVGVSIIEDAHTETPATDADYALVVTANCEGDIGSTGSVPTAATLGRQTAIPFNLRIYAFFGTSMAIIALISVFRRF